MPQRLPEHPCIQLRRCPHRGRHSEELKKHPMIVRASGILMVLICLATMFLKQHSVIDVVGALLMASVIYPIAYGAGAGKEEKVRDELLNIITSNLCRTVFTTVLFFAVFSNFYIHRSPSPPAFFECATAKQPSSLPAI